MARKSKKSKKKNLKTFLYYEVLGLVLLLLSILGIAKLGIIGKAVYMVSAFFSGNWAFIPLLYVIFVGGWIVLKQKYPPFFTRIMFGIYFIFTSILMYTHILLYDQKIAASSYSSTSILLNTWESFYLGMLDPSLAIDYGGGMIGGILYAALEGAFLGSFTYFVNQSYPGIALQAVLITFAVFFTMLVLFVTRLVRVTESMRAIIMGATFGIMIFYLISFVLDLFGVSIPLFTSSSLLSIGFSLFVAGIAAFGFLIDFDNVERMSQSNMPKYYEWYGAFGILVSLVWLYIEILNLLMKLKDR